MTFGDVGPAQGRPPRPQLSRRRVLQGTLWLGGGMGAAPLLAACGGSGGAAGLAETG
jgi:putative spermidine/putrescine transport system substrate-binding protein